MNIRQFVLIPTGIASAVVLVLGGMQMISIQSQAGNTITEAYYHAMGYGLIGLAIFIFGLTIAFSLHEG